VKIPQNHFRQPRGGCDRPAGHFHSQPVARQENLPDFFVIVRFIFHHPFELAGRKIAWVIEQFFKAPLGSQLACGLLTDFNGPTVAPDNCRPNYLLFPINAHQTMHLVGNPDGFDAGWVDTGFL